jgi:3-oxoacyl-[acyl-carrier-protein] synthase II
MSSHSADGPRVAGGREAGEGQADFHRFVNLVHRSSDGSRVDTRRFTELGKSHLDARLESEQEPGTPAGHLAASFGAKGPNLSCLTACSASAQAIGEAAELIRRGNADVMLAGGVHSMIHPLGLTGFILLTAMSTRNDDPGRASRPFDRDRDGFVIGEGGGMLLLEACEHARARGAVIYGEIAGQASTADAFRLTDCHDEVRGAIASMRLALADAGINPEDVDYVNAHGTSTKVNDSVETLAIKRALGDHAFHVPISSTKSMTGHLIAAGGVVETIACLLAIRDGVVPPTVTSTIQTTNAISTMCHTLRETNPSTSRCPTASASGDRIPRSSCDGSLVEEVKSTLNRPTDTDMLEAVKRSVLEFRLHSEWRTLDFPSMLQPQLVDLA